MPFLLALASLADGYAMQDNMPSGHYTDYLKHHASPTDCNGVVSDLSWSDSEWQQFLFSDMSRFCLGEDDQQICGGTMVNTKMSTSTPTTQSAGTV